MTENLIKNVDWGMFKATVFSSLIGRQLSSVDMATTKLRIRSIIKNMLSVYVDKQFMYNFRIEIEPADRQRYCLVQLIHKNEILAEWSVKLGMYSFGGC